MTLIIEKDGILTSRCFKIVKEVNKVGNFKEVTVIDTCRRK